MLGQPGLGLRGKFWDPHPICEDPCSASQGPVTTMALADPCSTTGWIYITGVLDATDLVFNWQLAYIAGSSGYRRYMALAYDGSDWLLRVLRVSGRSKDSA